MKLDKNEIKLINDTLIQHIPNLCGIYVFGSYASGHATDKSDVDIAYLTTQASISVDHWDISTVIANKIKKNIDLIHLNNASTVLRYQIISQCIRIFTKDVNSCDNFETLAYAMYFDLNDERALILKDIKKSGVIRK